MLFTGIDVELVEFVLRQVDVLDLSLNDASQRRPPAGEVGIERFEVDGPISGQVAEQRLAIKVTTVGGRAGTTSRIVGMMSEWATGTSTRPVPAPAMISGTAKRRVVSKQARYLAMLTQGLAMIGRHNDQRPVERVCRAQPIQQEGDCAIGAGNLGVVRRSSVTAALGRCGIGCVRVEVDGST